MVPGHASFKIPFRHLAIKDAALRGKLTDALARVLDHGQFLLGREVEAFETAFSAAVGVPNCVGVSSGTSALYLSLRALGVGPGDEVITPALSWVATPSAIKMTGATPVFVDIRDDLNIDTDLLNAAHTSRTAAVVPVHYCGRICDMPAVLAFAKEKNLPVIEDAAQAYGAALGGVKAGAFGDLGAFSLNPMKVLRSLGEAGAITFKDASLRPKLESLRYLGTENREHCVTIELNHKISALLAAFICVFMETFDADVARRRAIAEIYTHHLGDIVKCPPMDDPQRSVFFDYQIIADRRDDLRQFLEAHGIEVKIKYPLSLPDHAAFQDGPAVDVPRARDLVRHILSLPMEPSMPDADVMSVCETIRSFYLGRR
jgi:dTDP-4-amino-4,6-dideoxygalactose transaminase